LQTTLSWQSLTQHWYTDKINKTEYTKNTKKQNQQTNGPKVKKRTQKILNYKPKSALQQALVHL